MSFEFIKGVRYTIRVEDMTPECDPDIPTLYSNCLCDIVDGDNWVVFACEQEEFTEYLDFYKDEDGTWWDEERNYKIVEAGRK